MAFNKHTGVNAAEEAFFRTALPLMIGPFIVGVVVAIMKR